MTDQQPQIMKDAGCAVGPNSAGFFTAIIDPERRIIGEPLKVGEGDVIADLDFAQLDFRKRVMDARDHFSRPDLLSLVIDRITVVRDSTIYLKSNTGTGSHRN